MDKRQFDELTDLVEHAQEAELELETPAAEGRQIENVQGEKITLDDKIDSNTF